MYDPTAPTPAAPAADPPAPATVPAADTSPPTPADVSAAPTPAPETSLVDDRDVAAAHTAAPLEEPSLADRRDDTEPGLGAGDMVTFTYQDAAGGDVVRTGIVTRLTDEHDPGHGEGAVVAWLGDFSDPIPLDQLERLDG